MKELLEKARCEFLKMIDEFGSDPFNLCTHLKEMEKWAKFMLNRYPQADEEVILLSVWLHDIGHYPVPTEIDHAIRSEQRAEEFLSRENYPEDKRKEVLHCVRAHRCSDVLPKTLEAKITAFIDSASHMTDFMYFRMAKEDKEKKETLRVYAKMERDLRDLSAFPEIKDEMMGLYNAWTNLIQEYEKIEI